MKRAISLFTFFLFSFCMSIQLYAQELVTASQKFSSDFYGVQFESSHIVKTSSGDYYVLFEDSSGNFSLIGETQIPHIDTIPNWPDSSSLSTSNTIMAKLSGEDFSLISYVNMKNISRGSVRLISQGEDLILLNTSNAYDHYYVADSIYVSDSLSMSSYFLFVDVLQEGFYGEFDDRLIDFGYLSEGSELYVYSVGADSNPIFQELDVTIEAATYPDSTYYGSQIVSLVVNVVEDEVISSWKFGGENTQIRSSVVDSKDNVYYCGSNAPGNFTFNNIDTLSFEDLNGSNSFIVKYDKLGNEIFSFFSTWERENQFSQLYIDEDELYLSGTIDADSMLWNDQLIYNYKNEDKEIGFENGYFAKLDSDGSLDWIYELPGYLNTSIVRHATFDDDKIYVSFSLADGEVDYDGDVIDVDETYKSAHLIVLDKTTGVQLDYKVLNDANSEVLLRRIDYNEESEDFVLLIQVEGEHNIFDQTFGENGMGDHYLIRVENLDAVSNIFSELSNSKLKLAPNPVRDLLYAIDIELDIDVNDSYFISNLNGTVIRQLKYDELKNGVDVSNLSPGIYLLQIRGDNINTVKFVKI